MCRRVRASPRIRCLALALPATAPSVPRTRCLSGTVCAAVVLRCDLSPVQRRGERGDARVGLRLKLLTNQRLVNPCEFEGLCSLARLAQRADEPGGNPGR